MSINVIPFPNSNAKPAVVPSRYQLKWSTASNGPLFMHTADRAMIRRQLDSLMKRGIMAIVTKDGEKCGGIMAITQADDTILFQAYLDGESWGDEMPRVAGQ